MPEPQTRTSFLREDGREPSQLRPVSFHNGFAPHATGSTLVEWGGTRVLCAATVEERVPRWMREQNVEGGWVTAEYSMLPYSTLGRKARDISRGRIDGRSQEIQRLVGRSMRAAIDLKALGPRTLWIDCDVIQADGSTRTASITGGFVALSLAVRRLAEEGRIDASPVLRSVAAVSAGIIGGAPVLDLCYQEDSQADVDLNVVMTSDGDFVELQGAAEKAAFGSQALGAMLDLAREGIRSLIGLQSRCLAGQERE